MAIDFPTLPSENDLYTYLTTTWKWNGNAWEKSAATETGNVEGNTGEVAYYLGKGSDIRGATAFFYDGDKVGIGTSGPTEVLDVRGGITASGNIFTTQGITADRLQVVSGATFGGTVHFDDDTRFHGDIVMNEDGQIKVDGDGEVIKLNFGGGILDISANNVDIAKKLRHRSDSDTYIEFTPDNIELRAGDNTLFEGDASDLHIQTGISADHGATFGGNVKVLGGLTADTLQVVGGATFGGDVWFDGDIHLREDGEVGIGGDTEKIIFNGHGGGSSSITIKATLIEAGAGSGAYIRSYGDDETYIKFENDLHGAGNDGLQLFQSNKVMVDVTPTVVNVAGATFGNAGATFSAPIHITSGVAGAPAAGIVFSDGTTMDSAVMPIALQTTILSPAAWRKHLDFTSVTDEVSIAIQQVSPDFNKLIFSVGSNVSTKDSNNTFTASLGANVFTTGLGTPHVSPAHGAEYALAALDHATATYMGITAGTIKHKIKGTEILKSTENLIQFGTGISADMGITFGGTINCQDHELTRPKLKDYNETFHDVGDINASTAFDFNNGNVQKCKVTGTDTGSQIVFSLSNPPASGIAGSMTVLFEQGNAHGDVAFHSSIEFPGGNTPSLTATSSKMDIISFLTVDGGTTYYAFVGGINFTIN